MPRKLLIILCCFTIFQTFATEEPYEFSGKHFFASYLHCDFTSLCDLDGLHKAMDKAVEACGATILNKSSHIFPPYGLTSVYLLSESHASIHTYPEFGACFVDLFTCGDSCSAERFDAALQAYLKPKEVNSKVFLRNHTIEELSRLTQ